MSIAKRAVELAAKLAIRAVPRRLLTTKRFFGAWQERGVHVTPVHFYQPVPDTRGFTDAFWRRRSDMPGVDMNGPGQRELLDTFASRYKDVYDRWPREKTGDPLQYYFDNGLFVGQDAEIYYCMIRHFKPRRIYEIGSGFSTLLAAAAITDNNREGGPSCELVAIEPYPNDTLEKGFPGLTRLIRSPVQDVPTAEFQNLQDGDILFIDSSHVVTVGSDVIYEILEILPRLNKGVLVHVHDIFLPAPYPKRWVDELRIFWNEQYLLQAFLSGNRDYQVLWGGSYMHLNHPDLLQRAFASYDRERDWPASFWMRKVH